MAMISRPTSIALTTALRALGPPHRNLNRLAVLTDIGRGWMHLVKLGGEGDEVLLAACRLKDPARDLPAEVAIALELVLAIELIRRRLVGERGMTRLILQHGSILLARHGSLEVDERPAGDSSTIVDTPDGEMAAAPR